MLISEILLHLTTDLVIAGIIILLFKKLRTTKAFLKITGLLLASNLIDLDHLIAEPIYDIMRCSINFHPLHNLFLLPIYLIGLAFPQTRILSIGILAHLLIDGIGCLTLA